MNLKFILSQKERIDPMKASTGHGGFVLKPGAFCRVPPGVRHELSNPSKTDEKIFLLVQASQEDSDYIPAPFRTIEAALPFSPWT
jgi:glyoxylate utilization-related uncharacterized protein